MREIDYNKKLNDFENKHGDGYHLMFMLVDVKYNAIDHRIYGFESQAHMIRHYEYLFRTHRDLLMKSIGYNEGLGQAANYFRWQLFCNQWAMIGYEVCR